MEILEALNWRYATKKMTGEKLDLYLVEQILEAARLAPTSAGLQPFHIFVISNSELKQQIEPLAFNQPQITDCSHLLVFASWDLMSDQRIDDMYAYINSERSLGLVATLDVVSNLKNLFAGSTPEQLYHHSAKQAHIGFGMAIAAAAELRVDATPMEGFDKEALDELLKLKDHGLKSVTLLALGRRDEANDWLVKLKKVRLPREKFVTEII